MVFMFLFVSSILKLRLLMEKIDDLINDFEMIEWCFYSNEVN